MNNEKFEGCRQRQDEHRTPPRHPSYHYLGSWRPYNSHSQLFISTVYVSKRQRHTPARNCSAGGVTLRFEDLNFDICTNPVSGVAFRQSTDPNPSSYRLYLQVSSITGRKASITSSEASTSEVSGKGTCIPVCCGKGPRLLSHGDKVATAPWLMRVIHAAVSRDR